MTEPDRNKKLLGALLLEKGLIAEGQLQSALNEQKKHGGRLGYWLVSLGFLPVETLTSFFHQNRNAGRIETNLGSTQKACGLIPRSLALYYKIAPIRFEEKVLTVAMAEVAHERLVDLISEITGYRIDALIETEENVRSWIESGYGLPSENGVQFSELDENSFTVTDLKKGIKALPWSQLKNITDVGELFRSLITEAIKGKFREIVLKPEADGPGVYFKKDSLKPIEFRLTSAQLEDLTFFIFRLAKLNLLQQRAPQNGKFVVRINDRNILMVVSSTPSIYGMQLFLEMFDEKVLKHSYEELLKPFSDVREQIEYFLTQKKKGVIAITGPDGTGRTHFLYSLLSRAKEIYHNIHTLENSIRYPLNGIRQSEIPEEKLERVIEDYLYQSPDLMAVSVVKSIRAAEVAFLLAARMPVLIVLSSYDSFKAVEWLCGHNLKAPIKAGLLHCVISPRTIPRICPHCAVPFDGQTEQFRELSLPAGSQLKMNQGCDYCRQKENLLTETFIESFRIDDEAVGWIFQDHTSHHLRQSARSAGRRTLYDLVVRDAFSDHLDMLSIAKLQAAL